MELDDFYCGEGDHVRFTRQQASAFAKGVAGDFNPIHDVDNKRFCVPGDLLFSVALQRYGLSQQMRVVFSGMVGDGVTLDFPATAAPAIEVLDAHGKTCLSLKRSGRTTTDLATICAIIHCYVQFSGQAFPHILVPLMAKHQLMINPDRPLIIYESMSIELQHFEFDAPRLELTDARLDTRGKRGKAHLRFEVKSGGEVIGHGAKSMVLSGLRPFRADEINVLVNHYVARKNRFAAGA
jgi:hypothetical protein